MLSPIATQRRPDTASGLSVIAGYASGFIAHDWCGWNEQYGRFTHVPSGNTLVCQAWMRQRDWDEAQLEWLSKFGRELVVHRCTTGPYRETGDTMGTVAEITSRLRARVA